MSSVYEITTSDGTNVTKTDYTDRKGVTITEMRISALAASWETEIIEASVGKSCNFNIFWSGITSGAGTLNLFLSADNGKTWVQATDAAGTDVAYSVTGVITEPKVPYYNSSPAANYKWVFATGTIAGTGSYVTITSQVERD